MKNIPSIIYQLDKPREFKVSMDAKIKIQQLGINFNEILSNIKHVADTADFPLNEMHNILWACQVNDDLSPQEIGELIFEWSNDLESWKKVLELAITNMPCTTGKTMEETIEKAQKEAQKSKNLNGELDSPKKMKKIITK